MPARLLFAFSLLALLSGCTGPQGSAPGGADGPGLVDGIAAAPQDTVVALRRTACYGTCPVYEVALYGDGTVRYAGEAHVARTGAATGTVDRAAVVGLVRAFEEAGYSAYPDSIAVGNDEACSIWATDHPTVTSVVRVGERTKRVVHYLGCRGFEDEDALRSLEAEVDRVAGTERWVGLRP